MIKLINIYILTIKIEKCMTNIMNSKRKHLICLMEMSTKALLMAKLSMVMGFIAILMGIFTRVTGKTMYSREMESYSLLMVLSMKVNLQMDYHQDKVSIIINPSNTTI